MIKPSNSFWGSRIIRVPKPLPEFLIYKQKVQYSKDNVQYCFTAFSTKDKKVKAIMYCEPSTTFREDVGVVNSLYISYLNSFINSGLGLGSSLLNIAKQYSKQMGCGGYIYLYASTSMAPHRLPHVFYKKRGFNTGVKEIDKKLDKLIKLGKDADENDFEPIKMYYPAISIQKQEKFSFSKFMNKLGNIFLHSWNIFK